MLHRPAQLDVVRFVAIALALVVRVPLSADEPAELPPASTKKIDFARDIKPILAGACYKCHGEQLQEGNLRLDIRAAALKGGDSGEAILPGKSAESLLVQLAGGVDPDRIMPAKGDKLTREQVALLRAWIDQGANWPDDGKGIPDRRDWWSLKPIRAAALPLTTPSPTVRQPLDAFIQARLRDEKATPAPEADRPTLLRRLYFNLVGLPPTPDEVDAFAADPAPDAYDRQVDRLLASPRHGERWARHWMDIAHFAETHGHDQDRIREHAWPYRDYLIRSFNADKPYAKFVAEQVAGDALYPDDPQALVALGFLAAGPWDESSLRDIREDTLDRQIARYIDRDDIIANVMNTFVSTTVQCARCHDHKFDPVPQKDYYALQAVFAATDKGHRKYDSDPAVRARRQALEAERAKITANDRAKLLSAEAQDAVAEWERTRGATAWQVIVPVDIKSSSGATLTRQPDGSILASGDRPLKDTYTITTTISPGALSAVRLELLPDMSLPQRGPGRADNGNLHLNEIQIEASDVDGANRRKLSIGRASADFDQEGWGIAKSIDGIEATAWGIHPGVGELHHGVFEFARRETFAGETRLIVTLEQSHGRGHVIGRFRLAVTSAANPAQATAISDDVRKLLAVPAGQRSEVDRAKLAAFVLGENINRELSLLPPPSLVYVASGEFEPDNSHKPAAGPRRVFMLHRGDIRQPRDEAAPGAMTCIDAIPATFKSVQSGREGSRRAALANWLADPKNPLTWRTIVNRAWHYHFGKGIVDTPSDFGRMGSQPTHPELLDALAVDFRDGGGSLKQLHRRIVTSTTYRQSTRNNPALAVRDADNRLLARMNRTRLDAESMRDALLAAAGRIDLRMGGPSDRQFDLTPGKHVTPTIDYNKFDLDSVIGSRRSVYRFLFRTLPDPLADALDCPAGDQSAPVRNTSVTVQQSLALWNSAFVAKMADHMAVRFKQAAPTMSGQITLAARTILGRTPTDGERKSWTAFAERNGLAQLCRVLVNTNEFLFVD